MEATFQIPYVLPSPSGLHFEESPGQKKTRTQVSNKETQLYTMNHTSQHSMSCVCYTVYTVYLLPKQTCGHPT